MWVFEKRSQDTSKSKWPTDGSNMLQNGSEMALTLAVPAGTYQHPVPFPVCTTVSPRRRLPRGRLPFRDWPDAVHSSPPPNGPLPGPPS